VDVDDWKRIKWFWGLTCDFWAENGKNIFEAVCRGDFVSTCWRRQQQIPFGDDNQKGKTRAKQTLCLRRRMTTKKTKTTAKAKTAATARATARRGQQRRYS
jgi:hypothetical protein